MQWIQAVNNEVRIEDYGSLYCVTFKQQSRLGDAGCHSAFVNPGAEIRNKERCMSRETDSIESHSSEMIIRK